ncbi:unnamed protein product [Ceratitis capitata]|uniref:(Mediterranean fruit fly) hypothetical protein n=1 Tax=Ceratitis capitata TaxID=7213 RepID=W8BUI4_CERCA|nr:unnamed protein product [Ceratitis capitata]
MKNNVTADPIITVTLESSDLDVPAVNLDATTRSQLINGGLASNMQKPSKNFWIELPQFVFVETRFITQQIATQNKIYSAQTLIPITDQTIEEITSKSYEPTSSKTITPPLLVDAGSTVKPDVADAAISTDGPNPCRDRAQQTTKLGVHTADIGTQCNLEDESAFSDIFENTNEFNEKKIDEKQSFLRFSRENSIFYLNGSRECMVCGEIEKSIERMLAHLALHWGPAVLCHLCGLKFEHQSLMSLHRCGTNRHHQTYQQCPIYWCGVMVNSTKTLNKHLRKHFRIRRRRAYVTFLLEQTIVLKRPLITKINAWHRCNICLKRYKNTQKFTKHRKKCLYSFAAKLRKQKFLKPTTNI